MFAYLKFRWSRNWRKFQRNTKVWRLWLGNYVQRHILGKWHQLGIIRRLILTWWGVLLVAGWLLLGSITSLQATADLTRPRSGGTYREALVGEVRIMNPILPDTSASQDVNRLIYSGLVRYNPSRVLEADLASSWSVSADGKHYTFHLRPGVTWHDGLAFSAQDVAFTLAAIQNPDSRSPLASSWQGVTADILDDLTIVFNLPNSYPPFLDAATVGILPRHLLESTDPSKLRVADFNQHPIGTGPFKLASFNAAEHDILLDANPGYYSGRPRLDAIQLKTYQTTDDAKAAYAKQQVDGVSRIDPTAVDSAVKLKDAVLTELDLPIENDLFFKTTAPLLGDKAVRLALSQAINRRALIDTVFDGRARLVTGPILPGQLGYSAKAQPAPFNTAQATAALDAAGWIVGDGGVRQKGGKPLILKLATLDSGSMPAVATEVKRQWAAVGVALDITLASRDDLQQTYIRPRNYDILLFGITIGADPDVYGYWHSSQVADPGQNLSVYKSPAADAALEAGRVNTDKDVRTGKYASFQAAWKSDAPAVVLYSPYYFYLQSSHVAGQTDLHPVVPADRFYGIEHWTILSTTAQRSID